MSRKVRRGRKPRSHASPVAVKQTAGLKVAIVTAPYAPTDNVFLRRDLRLVRAAIMYADHVQLISPGAQMMQQIAPMSTASDVDAIRQIAAMDDVTLSAMDAPEGWRDVLNLLLTFDADQLAALGELGGADLSELSELRRSTDETFAQAAAKLREITAGLVETSGFAELQQAERAGLLTVTSMPVLSTDTDQLVQHYANRLKRLLRKGKNVHIVLDDDTAGLARAMLDEGKITVSDNAASRMKRALTSEGLLDRLPAFPDTPLDELLDMRSDLAEPLTRYRREVDTLSRRLTSGPLNEDIREEIGDLYVNQVAPALADLREQYAEHGLVRETAKGLVMDIKTFVYAVGAPAASLGIAETQHLSTVGQTLLTAGATGLVAGQQAIAAAMRRRDARQQVRSADLYYLLEIDRRTHSSAPISAPHPM